MRLCIWLQIVLFYSETCNNKWHSLTTVATYICFGHFGHKDVLTLPLLESFRLSPLGVVLDEEVLLGSDGVKIKAHGGSVERQRPRVFARDHVLWGYIEVPLQLLRQHGTREGAQHGEKAVRRERGKGREAEMPMHSNTLEQRRRKKKSPRRSRDIPTAM